MTSFDYLCRALIFAAIGWLLRLIPLDGEPQATLLLSARLGLTYLTIEALCRHFKQLRAERIS